MPIDPVTVQILASILGPGLAAAAAEILKMPISTLTKPAQEQLDQLLLKEYRLNEEDIALAHAIKKALDAVGFGNREAEISWLRINNQALMDDRNYTARGKVVLAVARSASLVANPDSIPPEVLSLFDVQPEDYPKLAEFLQRLRENLIEIEKYSDIMSTATADEILRRISRLDAEVARNVITELLQRGILSNIPNLPPSAAIPSSKSGKNYIKRAIDTSLRKSLCDARAGIAGIRGTGGIGKTELAISIATEYIETNEMPGGVVWVSLSGREPTIVLTQIEMQLGLLQISELTLEQKAMRNRRALGVQPALMVFDDVREEDCRYLESLYLPTSRCRVLITTRLHTVPGIPANALKDLDNFSASQARQLLKRIINNTKACAAESAELDEVARLCGYHALALEVSARLISEDLELAEKPIGRQADRLHDMRKRLASLAHPPANLDVESSLSVSYEALSTDHKECLDLLSVFQSEIMDPTAIASIWRLDDIATQDALKRLRGLSIATPSQGHWQMHELWRSFSARRFDERFAPDSTRRIALSEQHAEFFAKQAELYAGSTRYLATFRPDLVSAFNYLRYTPRTEMLFQLTWSVGVALDLAGEWDFLDQWLQIVLTRLRTEQDVAAYHRQGIIKGKLASITMKRGHWEQASEQYLAAIGHLNQLLDLKNVIYLQIEAADVKLKQGQIFRAEHYLRDALFMADKALENPGLAALARARLASLLWARGDYQQAAELYVSAAKTFRDIGNLRDYALVLVRIAEVFTDIGGWAIEQNFQEALLIFEQLGDALSIGTTKLSYAEMLKLKGESEAATRTLRDAVEVLESIGALSDLSKALQKLSSLLEEDDSDEALELLRQSLEISEKLGLPDQLRLRRKLIQLSESQAGKHEPRASKRVSRREWNSLISKLNQALAGGDSTLSLELKEDIQRLSHEATIAGESDMVSLLESLDTLVDRGVEAFDMPSLIIPDAYLSMWDELAAILKRDSSIYLRIFIREAVSILATNDNHDPKVFERRNQLLRLLRARRAYAQHREHDANMDKLVPAIIDLVESNRFPEKPLDLEGSYAACWEQIAAHHPGYDFEQVWSILREAPSNQRAAVRQYLHNAVGGDVSLRPENLVEALENLPKELSKVIASSFPLPLASHKVDLAKQLMATIKSHQMDIILQPHNHTDSPSTVLMVDQIVPGPEIDLLSPGPASPGFETTPIIATPATVALIGVTKLHLPAGSLAVAYLGFAAGKTVVPIVFGSDVSFYAANTLRPPYESSDIEITYARLRSGTFTLFVAIGITDPQHRNTYVDYLLTEAPDIPEIVHNFQRTGRWMKGNFLIPVPYVLPGAVPIIDFQTR